MAENTPELVYLLMVWNAIKDESSKKWSLINIFERIIIPANLEFLYQSFDVACRINNVHPGESKTEVKIISPDRKVFATSPLSGTLVAGDVSFVAKFTLLKFIQTGRYTYRVIHNGKVLAGTNNYYFDVTKQS